MRRMDLRRRSHHPEPAVTPEAPFFHGPNPDVDQFPPEASTWPEAPDMETMYGDDEPAAPDLARPDVPTVHAPTVTLVRPRRASTWSAYRVRLVADEAKQVAGLHLGRTSLIVRNLEPAPGQEVELGPGNHVRVGSHWPLPAGAQLTLDNTGEVWATAPAPASLVILAEFDTDRGGS